MADPQETEKEEKRKGKGKGKSKRIQEPLAIVQHTNDEDRDRMPRTIRNDLLSLFEGSEDRLRALSPQIYTVLYPSTRTVTLKPNTTFQNAREKRKRHDRRL